MIQAMQSLERIAGYLGPVEWHSSFLVVDRQHGEYKVRIIVACADKVLRAWVPRVWELRAMGDFAVALSLMDRLNFIRVTYEADTRSFSVGFEMPDHEANDPFLVSLLECLPSVVIDIVLKTFEQYDEKKQIEEARRRFERLMES